jgi:hypothetical protein
MSWTRRLAEELEKSRNHALAWLLAVVMTPWRHAGAARIMLASAAAVKTYRAQVRFVEQLLAGLIRERAAAIHLDALSPSAAPRRGAARRRRRALVRLGVRFRLRAVRGPCPQGGKEPSAPMTAPRSKPDRVLQGLRLMLRAKAAEKALPQIARFAWRWARRAAAAAAAAAARKRNAMLAGLKNGARLGSERHVPTRKDPSCAPPSSFRMPARASPNPSAAASTRRMGR